MDIENQKQCKDRVVKKDLLRLEKPYFDHIFDPSKHTSESAFAVSKLLAATSSEGTGTAAKKPDFKQIQTSSRKE